MKKLLVHKIKCIRTTDSGAIKRPDEIYLKFGKSGDNDKKKIQVWPKNAPYEKIVNKETKYPDVNVDFEDEGDLELWESDTRESIVHAKNLSQPTNGRVTENFNGDGGEYKITYEVRQN